MGNCVNCHHSQALCCLLMNQCFDLQNVLSRIAWSVLQHCTMLWPEGPCVSILLNGQHTSPFRWESNTWWWWWCTVVLSKPGGFQTVVRIPKVDTRNVVRWYAIKFISFSVSKFNLPLIGTFTWPTPPGPYRAMTYRGRELNYGSHTYLFDHTRTWRPSPDEWSAQCRGHLRDSTNMKDNTHQAHSQSSQQGEYGMMTTAKWYSGTLGA